MAGKGGLGRYEGFQIVVAVVTARPDAAPFGIADRLAGAGPGRRSGGIIGKHVFEISVETLFDGRAAGGVEEVCAEFDCNTV